MRTRERRRCLACKKRQPTGRVHTGPVHPPKTVVRYFAAVKAAAGVAQDQVQAATLEQALAAVRLLHDARFTDVLSRCSFIIDGDPVGTRDHATVSLAQASLVDCLPPFAGG